MDFAPDDRCREDADADFVAGDRPCDHDAGSTLSQGAVVEGGDANRGPIDGRLRGAQPVHRGPFELGQVCINGADGAAVDGCVVREEPVRSVAG